MLSYDPERWDGGRVGWRSGGREAQQGEDICMHIADSLCCTVEMNTALQSNYTPIKNKLKIKHKK